MDGASIIGEALKQQGVDYMFGVVGIPIMEVAVGAQSAGIHYIGMRNEQAASYAASAVGYLTRRPAACLVVPGPGLVHALSGMANAIVNCWPLVVIAGSYDQDQGGWGAFQEWPQVASCALYAKYAARVESLESIPFHIEKAVRTSIYGRPGPCYVEIPGNLVTARIDEEAVKYLPRCPDPPITLADPSSVEKAIECLRSAKKPLVIIGKGAAYARAEDEIKQLVTTLSLPFLPTPMGKGVVSDTHPLCVAAARSLALKEADVILLLGARLNWILHFGKPPRFNPLVKIIQVDIYPEEMGNSVGSHLMLCGDVKAVVGQLNDKITQSSSTNGSAAGMREEWWRQLNDKIAKNTRLNKELSADKSSPMTFYCAYEEINKILTPHTLIVNEGSSTMDIGRTMLQSFLPRHRLDAGTFGTMGVGCGFAIAAAIVMERDCSAVGKGQRSRLPVVCIQGDSAFGFSGMEFETACRYKLPILFIVMNNNGIYRGVDEETWSSVTSDREDLMLRIPPTSLGQKIRYDKMAECFGAVGYSATSHDDLRQVLVTIQHHMGTGPYLLNVEICPTSQRRAQEFSWLTRSNL